MCISFQSNLSFLFLPPAPALHFHSSRYGPCGFYKSCFVVLSSFYLKHFKAVNFTWITLNIDINRARHDLNKKTEKTL